MGRNKGRAQEVPLSRLSRCQNRQYTIFHTVVKSRLKEALMPLLLLDDCIEFTIL